jgi:hypothetical protein
MIESNPFVFQLSLNNFQIESWKDFNSGKLIPKLFKPLTSSDYKIYIITIGRKILYVGATKSSIKSRLNFGLRASGKKGYHGYKWKNEKSITIFIWNFSTLEKKQIENIEAELAFIIRTKTGKWPELQNEIHFNNSYEEIGKKVAEKIYDEIINF